MTSTIQSIPVSPTAPTNGQILQFNGTLYAPVAPNPGDITEVNTTLPLTGGGTGGALTLDIDNFGGDAGLGGTKGTVPAPAAGDALKFLRGDATWAAIAGGALTVLANVVDNASVTAAFSSTTDIITSGAVATAAGKSQLVIFGCDMFSYIPNTQDVLFQVYADAVNYGGIGANKYDNVFAQVFQIAIARLVTGLAAGNHTFKVSTVVGPAGGANAPFTNSWSGAETATRLIVLEF